MKPWIFAVILAACTNTTGGDRFDFPLGIAGPVDFAAGQPFATDFADEVTLTKATVHVGGVYLNRSQPLSGAQAQACVMQGIYDAEMTDGADIDALSPTPQWRTARATSGQAVTAEVWLNGGDVNALDDPTVVVDLAGTASQEGQAYPFVAQIHIGKNRLVPPSDPAQPGMNPPCKLRIVSPIAVDFNLAAGGKLLVRVDPRKWLRNIDFHQLPPPQGSSELYRIADDDNTTAGIHLFNDVRAREGVWTFTRQPAGN